MNRKAIISAGFAAGVLIVCAGVRALCGAGELPPPSSEGVAEQVALANMRQAAPGYTVKLTAPAEKLESGRFRICGEGWRFEPVADRRAFTAIVSPTGAVAIMPQGLESCE